MTKRLAPLLVLFLTGCATLRGCQGGRLNGAAESAAEKAARLANHAADVSLGLGYLGVIAFGCIALGIIIIIASFVPVVSYFVPRKAAVAAIACGVCVHLLRAFLDKFQTAILWGAFALVVIACACLLWPLIIAAHRGTLLAEAKNLIARGHVDAAAAMQIMATPAKFPGPVDRKALVAELITQVPADVPVVVGIPSPAVAPGPLA